MPLLLTEHDVRDLLTMPDAIAAVERITRLQAEGQAAIQPRTRLELPDKCFLHYMAGADVADGIVGMKIYTSVQGALRFLVLLYRSTTGELLALIEADQLGMMRTGAASGVATKYMARQDAHILGVIGTGHQAHGQLEAMTCVRKLETIRVYGRDAARRKKFAAEMTTRLKIRVEPAASAAKAVRGADIICTVTTSSKPVLEGEALPPGAHINAVGGNFPQKRELDQAAIDRVNRVCVDSLEQAKLESGDLIQGFANNPARWDSVRQLADVVAGKIPGRERPDEITLFKSNGIAIWDIAAGAKVFELAVQQKRGQKIPMWESKR
jgi:ornithine cyclodeaminase/alanine dehydrogenase-like protein (mu-crystallin family)